MDETHSTESQSGHDRHSPWWGVATLAVALLVAVAACGQTTDDAGSAGSGTTESGGAGPVTVEVVAVHEGVAFYIGCANEPLRHEGLEFWPLLPEEQDELDLVRYGTGMGVHILMVAPPGPGDDIGTLTVYADGLAYYVSDSGQEIWLSEQHRTYNWVC